MKYNYTLEQAIYAKKFKSKEKHILMLQITTVVWYLQSKKVFGLCLSPSNIVFDCSSENEIKLYQFSYAEIFDNTLKPLNISRDSIYSPPDQFLDEKNEIYSLGMIFYFLYTDGNFDITNDNTSTDDFFYFIKKMISSSMDTRPNIKEVYEFLKQIEKNLND
jgi:serine/threonine protein kinase